MPVTDEAIDKIKGMIISGALAPGDRLPREADLAARLGLSRSSLREAVKALCLVRVLDVRQGDGTYVTSLEPALLLDAMTFVVDFHRDETALDFLAVRRILEPAATAMAAVRMTDEDVADLATLLADPAEPTVEALVAHDLEFHRRIGLGSGNPVLCALIDSLSGPAARTRLWRGLTGPDAVARSRAQHRAIHEAIAARDPELARSWATAHVAGLEQCLRETLGPTGTPPAADRRAGAPRFPR